MVDDIQFYAEIRSSLAKNFFQLLEPVIEDLVQKIKLINIDEIEHNLPKEFIELFLNFK